MKSLLKRLVMWACNRELIKGSTVQRVFDRFELLGA